MTPFKPVIYRSFAEFFDREFVPSARPFPDRTSSLGAFAEARYFTWEALAPDQNLPVKGHSLDAVKLFGLAARAKAFAAR